MRVINDRRQNFLVSLVLRTTDLSNFKKRKKLNWYANLIIFCIVWITIVNESSENKITFQEYWMTFPYLQMPYFLDWLFTIKKVCVTFFDIKFLKKELLKNSIIFAHSFTYRTHVFWLEIFFAIEIKKCESTR